MRQSASAGSAAPDASATRRAHRTSSRMLKDPLGDQSVDSAMRIPLSSAAGRSIVSP